MMSLPKVMIAFAIILSTILFWATSNVCRYNFAIEKKTNQLNILAQEIDPSIPMAKVYYFKELNCNNVNLTWDYERVMTNLQTISVLIYQELSTDIRGRSKLKNCKNFFFFLKISNFLLNFFIFFKCFFPFQLEIFS